MNKIIGNIYKGLGRFLEVALDIIISLLDLIVGVLNSGRRMLGAFSFIIILAIFNPFIGFLILFSRWFWLLVFLFFIVPVLGSGLISFLRYGQYVITEFFYDRADFYLSDKTKDYKSFGDYSRQYRAQQEEARRREQEKRARDQQRMWEEAFKNYYRQTRGYGSQGQAGQGYNRSGPSYNPTGDFVKKYEESCKILGLEPTTDKYEIKLAYRKMAKKYHPDVNDSADATEKFQKINDANSFLSDENIERYKNITGTKAN